MTLREELLQQTKKELVEMIIMQRSQVAQLQIEKRTLAESLRTLELSLGEEQKRNYQYMQIMQALSEGIRRG